MIVKVGIDPTGKIHIGHLYLLKKAEKFLGYRDKFVILIGGYTCKIGDPSYRKEIRSSIKKIKNNIINIKKYSKKILKNKVYFLNNNYWYNNMKLSEFIKICDNINLNKLIKRKEIVFRRKNKVPIKIFELLYPIFQAYDNIIIKPNIEFGGKDQELNFIISKIIQRKYSINTKYIKTRLIECLKTKDKMSKSNKENCIFLDEKTDKIFWKILRIDDNKTNYYINLFRFLSRKIMINNKKNVNINKKIYLFYLLTFYKKKTKVKNILKDFINGRKNIKFIKVNKDINVVNMLIKYRFFKYKNEIKRLINQKSIKINKEILLDKKLLIKKNDILTIGKKICLFFI
ncbi:tyrosine--tRNA ligase [Candidatus Vidania fulgoroideorum]